MIESFLEIMNFNFLGKRSLEIVWKQVFFNTLSFFLHFFGAGNCKNKISWFSESYLYWDDDSYLLYEILKLYFMEFCTF